MMPQDLKWRNRYKELFARCERFLAEGNHMKKTLVELGCAESKVLVQRLGVDLEKIPFIPRKLESVGDRCGTRFDRPFGKWRGRGGPGWGWL